VQKKVGVSQELADTPNCPFCYATPCGSCGPCHNLGLKSKYKRGYSTGTGTWLLVSTVPVLFKKRIFVKNWLKKKTINLTVRWVFEFLMWF
jgi:hypothetical protein